MSGYLSGPVLRATASLSQRCPTYPALWAFGCLNMKSLGAVPLPLPLACALEVRYPYAKGYLSDTCARPLENKTKCVRYPLCDNILKRYCAIWGGYIALGRGYSNRMLWNQFLKYNHGIILCTSSPPSGLGWQCPRLAPPPLPQPASQKTIGISDKIQDCKEKLS